MTYITYPFSLCLAMALLPAAALGAPPAGEPLDPEKAFPVTARLAAGGVDLAFRIVEGYYLYADRFRVEADPGLPVGAAQIPKGEPKDDPFIGRTEVLRHSATVRLPITGPAKPGTYAVKVTAQGCAEEKVCYAPFTQVVRVRVPAAP